MAAATVTAIPKSTTAENPISVPSQGTGTLIPQRLKIKVGTAKRIVTDVRNFMICDRRLEIIEEKESIMDIRMFV